MSLRYSKPKQCRFQDTVYSMTENTQFPGFMFVSPGSAEILVNRSGITNRQFITCSLSNISTENYQNRLMSVEAILCNISVVFLKHSVVFDLG